MQLPLTLMRFLDLANADNARIWWAIREYAIVDSLDERTDLEVQRMGALPASCTRFQACPSTLVL